MWSDWPKMGQIQVFLRSVGSASQNVLKLFLKGPKIITFGANLTQFRCQISHPCLNRVDSLKQGWQGHQSKTGLNDMMRRNKDRVARATEVSKRN